MEEVVSREIQKYFEADHCRLDSLFSAFVYYLPENIPKACEYFYLFREGLLQHIEWEEKILFKIFEENTGVVDGPTKVMRVEHKKIKNSLDLVANFSADEQDFSNQVQHLRELLSMHNEKVETILYPLIQQCCNELELSQVFLQISQTAKKTVSKVKH
jgi:iron-sulfur cluster repair protein YtfE (RIC family)